MTADRPAKVKVAGDNINTRFRRKLVLSPVNEYELLDTVTV